MLVTAIRDIEFALSVFDAAHTAGIINIKAQPTIDFIGQLIVGILSKVAAQAPPAPTAHMT
jgi:hypothetical protein